MESIKLLLRIVIGLQTVWGCTIHCPLCKGNLGRRYLQQVFDVGGRGYCSSLSRLAKYGGQHLKKKDIWSYQYIF